MSSEADELPNVGAVVSEADELTFNFVRSPLYRNIHADGCFGGPTPRSDIYVVFFTEHLPIPESTTHALSVAGLGEEKTDKRVITPGIVREQEAGITMSLGVARSVVQWLSVQIDEAERLIWLAQKEAQK